MAKLLYVESSPRKERSSSIAVAAEFIRAYRAANPDHAVETLDLWSTPLPEFDGATIDAKYRILHGEEHTPEEASAWRAVVELFERFASADKYLFSLPMWNFGVPYRLKHFIDVIAQPGLGFQFSPREGYRGLVTGRPAAVIYARGSVYGNDGGLDYQRPYLETILRFIGFSEIRPIVIEPTLGPPESSDAVKAAAKQLAAEIAATF